MRKKWKKQVIWPAALCCMAIPAAAAAAAADTAQGDKDFLLEGTVVTAMRYVTSALDTPADVQVVSHEQLKNTGAKNLMDALKYTEGVTYYGYGPHGQSWGGMNSKLTIRGMEGGTLVLINGVSANLNGVYHLEQFSLDNIERIEVVKGGGSVLYGTDAYGGVINIITKKQLENTVTIANGSDQESGAFTMQAGKAGITYKYSKERESDPFSDTLNPNSYKVLWRNTTTPVYMRDSFGPSIQHNLNLSYCFDEHLNLTYLTGNNNYSLLYKEIGTGSVMNAYHYNDQSQRIQIEYKDSGWTGKLYYNGKRVDNTNVETARPNLVAWGKEHIATYGTDVQKMWKQGDNSYLGGITLQKETYEKQGQSFGPNSGATAANRYLKDEEFTGPYHRMHYSAYGQWDTPLSTNTRAIFSAREDMVNPSSGTSYKAFCPQFQTITRIDKESSWYTNVGKSFKMPTFTQLYMSTNSNFTNNPDLKPEHGINYEIGYKVERGRDNWKAALFKTEVTDKIAWKTVTLADGSTPQRPVNLSSFKNAGLEVSYGTKLSNTLTWTVGGTCSNPQSQADSASPWLKTLGRTQLSTTLAYKEGATAVTLSATYFGDRTEYDKAAKKYVGLAPMLPVNLHISHDLNKDYTVNFTVDNLLNREDYSATSGSGGISHYYFMPRSYTLSLTTRF